MVALTGPVVLTAGSLYYNMIKPSIQTLIAKSLITFLLILALFTVVISGANFRELSKQSIENQALAHAKLVRAGLTAHMKGGIMDKRGYYLDEIRQLDNIKSLEIVRGASVMAQFGEGLVYEKPVDEITAQVFASKQPLFIIDEFTLSPTIRAIIPYIASSDGRLNCLGCHQVEEGTVLGAVDIVMDVSEYQRWGFMVLVGIFATIIIFLSLILINTIRTVHKHVQRPLEDLIKNADTAFHNHQPVHADEFETREFVDVANEINLFNNDIIAHQDMLKRKNHELEQLNSEIESTLRDTVYTMGVIEEQRSKETSNHTKRVTLYSQLIAEKMGLTPREIELVTLAAPLHDIGKIGIPDNILLKPGKLNDAEYEIMKTHSRIGYTMLSHSERDILQAASIIALQHHEKWNGTGYPQGLKGEGIHIFGRIIALADVFDALYSPRVYKKAWDLENIIKLVTEERGQHFDPQLVDIFLRDINEFVDVCNQYPSGFPEDGYMK